MYSPPGGTPVAPSSLVSEFRWVRRATVAPWAASTASSSGLSREPDPSSENTTRPDRSRRRRRSTSRGGAPRRLPPPPQRLELGGAEVPRQRQAVQLRLDRGLRDECRLGATLRQA